MKNIGIYIHIPFCESKCPYCDFYSINNKDEYDNYTSVLSERICKLAKKYDREVDTIYFGGGTPSVIGTDRLVSILSTVKKSFHVSADCETTVEVNPNSALSLDFEKMKQAGFNRLSVGMQSADQNELKTLGRLHTTKDVADTVAMARTAGFDNISLDLMLCIPCQTKDSLSKSIEFCNDLGVTHISAYILKIEKNTKYYAIKDKLPLLNDDDQAQMYLYAVSKIEEFGYDQYEISNFAKKGFESKHNLKYWHDEEYLGVGPSAHSYINGKRFYYDISIEDFYNDTVIYESDGGGIEEYIMLALRLSEGLDINKTMNIYPDFYVTDKLSACINKLTAGGLVEFDGNTIRLTANGFLVSNSVISYILDNI